MITMINSLSMMGGEDAEKFKPFDLDEIGQRAKELGEGVDLIKAEKLERKAQFGYSAVYKFKDINKLVLEDDPVSLMPDDLPTQDSEEGEVDDGFTFEFTKYLTSNFTAHLCKTKATIIFTISSKEKLSPCK